jgi:hypothetical protein
MSKTVQLPIKDILRPRETQMRESLNEAHIEHLMEIRKQGIPFKDLPIVYSDGHLKWAGDGHHRIETEQRRGQKSIEVELRPGTLRDAILCAIRANHTHGLNRKPEDKRRAVTTLLQDVEWGMWNNSEIAREAGVSEGLVRLVKGELRLSSYGTKVRRGGTVYKQKPRKAFGEMDADEQAEAANEARRLAGLLETLGGFEAQLKDMADELQDHDLDLVAPALAGLGKAKDGMAASKKKVTMRAGRA